MTVWLAIDTSSGTSVAVARENDILAEVNFADPMGHAENIGEAIAQVLLKSNLSPKQIDSVAVGRGPAPFTGLRVGIAAAIAFAEGAGAQLYGFVSHDAIALSELSESATTELEHLAVRTDARRREEYWSLYSGLDERGLPVRSNGPAVASPAEIDSALMQGDKNVASTRSAVSAASLAALAVASQKAGTLSTDVQALYLRAPDATEPKAHGRVGKPVSG